MLLRLCCSLCSSVCMKHRIPPMLGASGFPFLFTRIHRFPANEKDFSLALEMTVRESGILAALPSPAERLWCGDTALPPSYGRRCPEGAKVGSRSGIKRNGEGAFSHIAFPSTAEGTLLQSASSPALLILLHETPYPTFMEYQASRFRSHAYTV